MCEYIHIHTMSVFIYLGIEPVFVRAQKYLFMREFDGGSKCIAKFVQVFMNSIRSPLFLRLHSHRLDATTANIYLKVMADSLS